jgi:large subunit ribosomal protein L25
MPEITLTAETGRPAGSRPTNRLRKAGKIPGVIYGHGIDPMPIAVDARELRHALNTEAGANALLNLTFEGGNHLAMAKSLQRHPVRGNVVHVDFQVVSRDEAVTAEVPISLVGEAKEVLSNDGVVDQQLFAITVNATPTSIPNVIEVDISGLTVGNAIRVGDLKLPAKVTTDLDPEEAVVVAQGAQVSDLDLIPEADAEALAELAEIQATEGEGASTEGAVEGTAEAGTDGAGSDTASE